MAQGSVRTSEVGDIKTLFWTEDTGYRSQSFGPVCLHVVIAVRGRQQGSLMEPAVEVRRRSVLSLAQSSSKPGPPWTVTRGRGQLSKAQGLLDNSEGKCCHWPMSGTHCSR